MGGYLPGIPFLQPGFPLVFRFAQVFGEPNCRYAGSNHPCLEGALAVAVLHTPQFLTYLICIQQLRVNQGLQTNRVLRVVTGYLVGQELPSPVPLPS